MSFTSPSFLLAISPTDVIYVTLPFTLCPLMPRTLPLLPFFSYQLCFLKHFKECCLNHLHFLTSLSFFNSETYFIPTTTALLSCQWSLCGHIQQILTVQSSFYWAFPLFFADELSSSPPFDPLTPCISLLLHSLLNVFPTFYHLPIALFMS